MKKLFMIACVSIIACSSCTTSTRIMDSVRLSSPTLSPLTREQYLILQDVEGNGTASSVLCFGAFGCKKKALDKAMYDAIGKVFGADMLIAPRYEIETYTALCFYQKITVRVKAKAIQLITDK